MWLLTSPFLVARLCSVSRVLRFLPVSPCNVRSLAVAAFDLVYCSPSVLRFVFVLDIRDFKIQEATAFRTRWPGKSLERGRRCKRGKFMLRFATRLGQYQYINRYKGFDEETKIGCLPKNVIITATLLGGRNYSRRRIFSALGGVCSTKSSILALGIREIFSRKQKFCRMQSWFSRR